MFKNVLLLLIILATFGCQKAKENKLFISKEHFETGLDFQNNLPEDIDFNIFNYYNYYNGAGVAVGDINNDGLQDIYFSSNIESNKLYLNKGELKFEDITVNAKVSGKSEWSTGVTMVDINGDGWLDIYSCSLGGFEGKKGTNELFINNGDLTFTESAKKYGLDISTYATQVAFVDFDNDGDLDMYLLNHSIDTSNSFALRDIMLMRKHNKIGDRLYKNIQEKGETKFIDVTEASGILSTPVGFGLGIGCSDINNDGWVDIYISNDFHENDYLYINQGDGTFKESLNEWIEHTSKYSMGNDIADFNNDGLTDIITLDMLPNQQEILQKSMAEDHFELREIILKNGYAPQLSRNCLQLNTGNRFLDIAPLSGVYATDWSWSPLIVDLDNDGYKDIYITNGIFRRPNDLDYLSYTASNYMIKNVIGAKVKSVTDKLTELMPQNPVSNVVYNNSQGLSFQDTTNEWGLYKPSNSNGSAYADFDNDGDLDLVVNNVNEKALFYENKTDEKFANRNNLKFIFKGNKLNSTGIGAKVIIYNKGNTYYQEQFPVRGFMSSKGHNLLFGLGTQKTVDSLHVIWPKGTYQSFYNINTNTTLEVKEHEATGNYYATHNNTNTAVKPFFNEQEKAITYLHKENSFNEILREYLIPRSVGTEGPGLAVGDINNDGLDDVFMTNSQNNSGHMFIQQKSGSFIEVNKEVFENDKLYEGVDAVFFDADNDNDLDLYVVSAGNDYRMGEEPLSDRLYINDGQGNFNRKLKALPNIYINSSCVKPADYDKDGDIDLFIGGRVVAGSYGLTPKSYFLQNDGQGNFSEISLPPEISNLGMVTDAVWADFDGDSWVDLAVVGEWMSITILKNNGGKFMSSSIHSLPNLNGWWNCIIADDFDNDGDADIVAGNVGLNTILKASPEKPIRLYLKDFDNNGSLDQIMTHYKDDKEYAFATKDQLNKQLSFLKKRFPSYNSFSGVSMEKMLNFDELEGSIKKEANKLETVYLENIGEGKFNTHSLPIEANMSTTMSIASKDINEDGLKDIIIAGNFYEFNPGMGRQDSSQGLLLINQGNSSFKAINHSKSGIKIKGQVKKMKWISLANQQQGLLVTKNNENVILLKLNQ